MPNLTPPLKWHGGKQYLAKRIISHFPEHTHYVEPFAGGLAVLLAKPASLVENHSEVVNDLNNHLSNFWVVLADPELFPRFERVLQAIPFSQRLWEEAKQFVENNPDPEQRGFWYAVAFFVYCRQSLAGRMDAFAPMSKSRTRRGMNEQASAWLGAIEGLSTVHARLKRVVVLNDDALKVIKREDSPHTLFYLDPPYVPDTRATLDVYAHEMTREQHEELLATLLDCKGKVILSGYPNEMYDAALAVWRIKDFDIDNKSAGGKSKRRMTERLWMNF